MARFDDRNVFIDLAEKDVTKSFTKVKILKTPILIVLVVFLLLIFYMIYTENFGINQTTFEDSQYGIGAADSFYGYALYKTDRTDEIDSIQSNIDEIYEQTYRQDLSDELMINLTYVEIEGFSDYSHELYINKKGLSFDYIRPESINNLSTTEYENNINDNALLYECKGYDDIAFISLNKAEINKIVVEFNDSTQEIEIDSTTHFVKIIENGANANNITLYDINGDVVEYKIVMPHF